jgi:hypothetical protein
MMEGVNSAWYIWYIVRTFINATTYPHLVQQWTKKRKCIFIEFHSSSLRNSVML